MIKSVIVTNYLGDSISLDLTRPEKSGFIIKSITGLGPTKANINTADVPTNDGSVYNSARLSQRNVVLSIQFTEVIDYDENGNLIIVENIESVRQKTYQFFPIKKKITLVFETENRYAQLTGYVESNDVGIFSKEESTSISIVCPDPYFYSAGPNGIVNTTFFGVEPAFEFPFSNESLTEKLIEFGQINRLTENIIPYDGDANVGMLIIVHAVGDVEGLMIANIENGEKMIIDTAKLKTMTGNVLTTGDTLYINTIRGQKSVNLLRDGETINVLNCLSKDSDWFELSKGNNLFVYSADKGDTNLQFSIQHRIIYEGI